MLINNFLTSRKSDRNFKNKSVKKETVERLKQVFNLAKNDVVNFEFFENGKAVLDILKGYAGYNGVMVSAPAYIAVSFDDKCPKNKVTAMYKAEEVLSLLTSEDLGSCWIGLFDTPDDVKIKAFGHKDVSLILAVGYPKPSNPFVKEEMSERLPVEKIVFKDNFDTNIEYDELEKLGLDAVFYYVRFAPSTLNSQPWRFVLKGNKVELYLKEINGKLYYEDMGIILYYLEQMYNMSSNRELDWSLEDEFKLENGMVKIATINL